MIPDITKFIRAIFKSVVSAYYDGKMRSVLKVWIGVATIAIRVPIILSG